MRWHLKLLPQFFIAFFSLWWNWDIKIFPFLLTQHLKPTIQTRAQSSKCACVLSKAVYLHSNSYHPMAPCFCSSEMPKDMEPMKSFLLVKSQSQISTDRRRSTSVSLSLLTTKTHLLDHLINTTCSFDCRF